MKQVRVRFAGFRNTDDEWVNVKTDLRERSIPLEPAECHMVNVGDLVMSFQEKEEQSLYFDAHVVAIQRQDHDATECKCVFLVRYDHDNSEDEVQCSKLCRRPSE
ncbi:Protein SAWADEE HOMEODOMAIN [Turnera subulata]|uniref:Protein SAWADEE HOMEODOMAIN n=1 Tax=Turnera subulata TaxID=218843 RepID=A0A9Q0J2G0_9ROSI|nr:Protein SAWADEE HOMEODOMAIN [Turnera subulata]